MSLSLAIDALGFSVIAIGVRNICSRPVWWCFVLFTMLYFSIEASLDWEMWSAPAEAAISANYKFGFAACKVIYTLMLTGIVAAFGMPQADWEAGPLHWILRVAGVAPGRSAHAARRQSTAS